MESLTIANVALNRRWRRVVVGGQTLVLTDREFDLLEYFMARAGEVVSRNDLLQDVMGVDAGTETHGMDATIAQLREKLVNVGAEVSLSARGEKGYLLTPLRLA